MKKGLLYEDVMIEIVLIDSADVITSSSAFDGEEDSITEWYW